MKRHPRIRKKVKWAGAVVTVLLVVVWVGSGCVALDTRCGETEIMVWLGQVQVERVGPPQPRWSRESDLFWSGWQGLGWRWYTIPSAFGWKVVLPLWPVALLSLATTAATWRLDILARRRASLSLCPKCNYDRTGLAAGAVCPECGAAPLAPAPSTQASPP